MHRREDEFVSHMTDKKSYVTEVCGESSTYIQSKKSILS